MPQPILAIGPIYFTNFELPPEINFGGRQRLAVHHLADGRRIIDCLGRDDADISFSGVFAGADATLRAEMLDELRRSGVLVPLTWDVFYYSVVVREFSAQYRSGFWVPYTLRCTVVRDETSALLQAASSLAEQLVGDVIAASIGEPTPGVDFDALSADVSASGATTFGSEAFQIARSNLASSYMAMKTELQADAQPLAGVGFLSDSADAAIAELSSGAVAAQQIAWLARAQGYVGRAIINLTNPGPTK